MSPNRKTLWLALALLAAPSSFAATLRIANGPQPLVDGSILYGCIAYQNCSFTTYELAGDAVTVTTSKSAKEVVADLTRCDLGQVKVDSVELLKVDGTASRLAISHDSSSKINLMPAVLAPGDLEKIKAVAAKYAGQPESEALRHVLKDLGIPTRGFSIELTTINAGGITHPSTKMVEIADGIVDPTFIEALLHEFTHVQQWKLFDQCFDEGKATFESQNRRERGAYLEGMQIDQAITTPYTGGQRRRDLDSYKNSDDS
jgi:hypothetical protein